MLLTCLSASAQAVNVDLSLEQQQFLPSESLPVAVHITNRSGQSLHLGADANWLTFDVESADGFIVIKNADAPVVGEFDLGSSEVATKRVDLAPYFTLTQAGRYRVIATVRIKDWNTEISSAPQGFDVIDGAKLWSQTFRRADARRRDQSARRKSANTLWSRRIICARNCGFMCR